MRNNFCIPYFTFAEKFPLCKNSVLIIFAWEFFFIICILYFPVSFLLCKNFSFKLHFVSYMTLDQILIFFFLLDFTSSHAVFWRRCFSEDEPTLSIIFVHWRSLKWYWVGLFLRSLQVWLMEEKPVSWHCLCPKKEFSFFIRCVCSRVL